MEVNCPTCNKKTPWEKNPDRPFCSERCRLIDLGAWAMEKHAVPGDHTLDSVNTPTGENSEEEED